MSATDGGGLYRTRTTLEAWRYGGEPVADWPTWLRGYRHKSVDPSGPAPLIEICGGAAAAQVARPGDWIVRHLGGRLGVWNDVAFHMTFEAVA